MLRWQSTGRGGGGHEDHFGHGEEEDAKGTKTRGMVHQPGTWSGWIWDYSKDHRYSI